ncbi:MAG: TonB-dependent receptor plug domain-containing protein [Cellvibrionales bacterium]|nr:TonB-dependent receptor plug domain-containing protein [Cellvibrionales bacterium]
MIKIIFSLVVFLSIHTALSDSDDSDSAAQTLEETVIVGKSVQDKTQMTRETKQLLQVAGAANDPLNAVYSMPGVTFSGGWQTHDPVIRGSAPADNAYYIDGIPAKYIFHVFGNSIFSKNIIHRFDLKAGAFTGFYNNATGGIIDVSLRDPEIKPLTTTLNWSFLSTSSFIESKITDNSAFYMNYRKSLLREYDALVDLKSLASNDEKGFAVDRLPADQDFQTKVLWQLKDQQKITLSISSARDDLAARFSEGNNLVERDPDFAGHATIKKGFDRQGIHFEQESDLLDRFEASVYAIQNFDRSTFGVGQFEYYLESGWFLRLDADKTVGKKHRISAAFSYETMENQLKFDAKIAPCDSKSVDCATTNVIRNQANIKKTLSQPTLYLKDVFQVADKHQLTLALNMFYDTYLKQSRFEPRVSWQYLIEPNWVSFAKMGLYSRRPGIKQIIAPLGNPKLALETATHYLIGSEIDLTDVTSLRIETYYKTFAHLANNISQTDPQKKYNNGAEGSAYGVEFFLNKRLSNQWYGWASVGYAKTARKNSDTGEAFLFEYDKPLMINLVAHYEFIEHWTLGGKWRIESGGRYTPIVALNENANFAEIFDPIYGKPFSERLPLYHQLDVRIEYLRERPWGFWKFYTDLLNAYNQKNITGYRYAPNQQDTIKPPKGFGKQVPVTAQQGLGIIPSIGFEAQF